MKANELRIGSIVKSLVNDEDFSIVEEIGHRASLGYYVSLNNQHSGVWLEHKERDLILGIPLTEEWLLRMGFEKKENGLFTKKLEYIYNSIKYCEDYKIWIYYNDDNDAACNSIADLNFVHELQNLYFALTKKELTIM
jgi:hypothetical protein